MIALQEKDSIMSALGKIFRVLGSAKLAIALIFLVALFSLFGVIIPQENVTDIQKFQLWQQQNPVITKIAEPLGLFTVFTSWIFILILIALAINTLTCTVLKYFAIGGYAEFKSPGRFQKTAFLLLHISIIILIAAGAWSAVARFDAQAVLTKGQVFKGTPREFVRFSKGPLADEYVQDFSAKLEDVQTEFHGERLLDITSSMVFSKDEQPVKADIKVNRPFNFQGVEFTQDKTGYSILLDVRDLKKRRQFKALVVLKTFDEEGPRVYSNYLKREFMKDEVMITLLPGHTEKDGEIIKTSEQPESPILFMEKKYHDKDAAQEGYLPLEDKLVLGDYEFEFLGLRKWASFRISQDPGYLTVCIALWLGLAALILRYAPDFLNWFKNETVTTEND